MRKCLSLLSILLLVGCSTSDRTETAPTQPRSPMILFAVDGLEWNVMSPLLSAGKLPVIAGLMSRGTYGHLESMEPTYSAVIWTSIATGKPLEEHGIRHFVYQVDNNGRRESRYYTSGHRRTKAFWNILSDFGLKVHCVGWWMTYPAEAINGTMVSQTNTTSVLHDPQRALWKGSLLKGVEDQVYPPDYQNHVMDLLEESDASMDGLTESIFGRLPNPPDEFGQIMWDQGIWAMRADAVYLSVADDILQREEPFDLLAVYVSGTDVVGHRFWRYAYPGEFADPPSAEQLENYGNVINDYYVYLDQSIGRILDASPDSATVMIVSDHGMHSNNRLRVFNAQDPPQHRSSGHHRDAPPGVFIAAGPHIRRTSDTLTDRPRVEPGDLQTVGGILDVLPTILVLKGVPLGLDFAGVPMRSALDTDWLAKTQIGTIDTHDTEAWIAGRDARIRDAIDESERLDQLRSLGYIR